MTTYLATTEAVGNMPTYIAIAFCSPSCRAAAGAIPSTGFVAVDDSSYEFEETCYRCGATIPAARMTPGEMVSELSRLYGIEVK